jgi:Domain of unknown function (DUF4129)
VTSRQPETTPPEATVRARRLLAQVLPLALLIILGLAGLRGVLTAPQWNGPLHRDGPVISLALEVVLLVLLVVTIRRRAAAQRAELYAVATPGSMVEVKLRAVLIPVLGAGMIVVAVTTLLALHLHLFTNRPAKPRTFPSPKATPLPSTRAPGLKTAGTFHLPVAALLDTLLVALLIAAVLVSIWWARRLRPSVAPRAGDFIAEDPESLREAVESGRSALRTLDDARAAIIACYVAMEASLAERGAARTVADTPDELLARATEKGVVRGTAAARLTALFYEARFSSHPLAPGQRDAAERALDELAAALAEVPAAAGPARADA